MANRFITAVTLEGPVLIKLTQELRAKLLELKSQYGSLCFRVSLCASLSTTVKFNFDPLTLLLIFCKTTLVC